MPNFASLFNNENQINQPPKMFGDNYVKMEGTKASKTQVHLTTIKEERLRSLVIGLDFESVFTFSISTETFENMHFSIHLL